MKVSLLAILILCFSCKAQKKGHTEDTIAGMDSVLTLLICDDYGGSEIRKIQVVKDEKSLEKLFAKINRTRKPGIPVPQMDFRKEIAIFASRGEAKGSSQIQLKFSLETSEQLVFEVGITQKSEGTAITTPFCLYRMPFTQKELVFKEVAD